MVMSSSFNLKKINIKIPYFICICEIAASSLNDTKKRHPKTPEDTRRHEVFVIFFLCENVESKVQVGSILYYKKI
jgi:hypothetical protein